MNRRRQLAKRHFNRVGHQLPLLGVDAAGIEFNDAATGLIVLKKHGLLISMSGKGNCYDNAVVETFFKTIKSELIWPVAWQTRNHTENAVARYIDGFYNPIRRHSTLGYQSPIQFEMAGRE